MRRASGLPGLRASIRRRVLPALLPRRAVLLRGAPAHAKDRRVALTFDDGPDDLTGRFLDLLDELGVRATFFLIGAYVQRRPGALDEYLRRGHEVASHGYTHLPFPTLTPAALRDELHRTAALLPPALGRPLVRPPRGAVSAGSLCTCARQGYVTAMWSLDSLDYKLHDGAKVLSSMATRPILPGEIILLHEGQTWTLDALPGLIARLRREDLLPVTLSELVAASSASTGYAGPAGHAGPVGAQGG